MKTIVVLFSFAVMVVAYKDVDDSYYDTVISNMDALRVLCDCLVDKGPCNDFGQHVKDHIREVLKDGCRECDVAQKHYSHIVINAVKTKLPELYEQFIAKYDPKRKLLNAVDEKIKNY